MPGEKSADIPVECRDLPDLRGIGFENGKANINTVTATTNPAIGPAIPISKSAARERIGERMRMNAPSVPINVGAGMKKGNVAFTP